MVPLLLTHSNTVPSLDAPPVGSGPRRLLVRPRIRQQYGISPLPPLKEPRVMRAPLLLTHSNTVPALDAPPKTVVPKRLPLASLIRVLFGLAPLVPLKKARGVMVPLPLTTSNTSP